jgi:hypothetical protein
MSSYTESLEKQNIELQERLADAEKYISWLVQKPKYFYILCINYRHMDDVPRKMPRGIKDVRTREENIARSLAKQLVHVDFELYATMPSLPDAFPQTLCHQHVRMFRNNFIVNHIYIMVCEYGRPLFRSIDIYKHE